MTTVGNYAFTLCANVKSVTLPASVTGIGENAFCKVGIKTGGCTFRAASGSRLSSIGTDAYTNYFGNVDLRNCTSLTEIGAHVFRSYKRKFLYLPVSVRTIAANAISTETFTNSDDPKVRLAYANSIVMVNGVYKAEGTGTLDISSALNIESYSSKAVSIRQIFFDEIGLAWDSTDRYFKIADEQDLIDLGNYVIADSGNTCEGLTFKMTADLDFSGISHTAVDNAYGQGNFMPIGMTDHSFQGVFDGQSHTITGLYFVAGFNPVGLFGWANDAVIRDFTLVSPEMESTNEVGGIVGRLNGDNGPEVSRCTVVNGKLKSTGLDCGGIVGAAKKAALNISISICTVVNTSVSGISGHEGILTGAKYQNCSGLTITNCVYHNPDGLPLVGLGYSLDDDDKFNRQVYRIATGSNVTVTGNSFLSLGGSYYCGGRDAFTLDHGDLTGHHFDGYTVNGSPIEGNTYTMREADVTVEAVFPCNA